MTFLLIFSHFKLRRGLAKHEKLSELRYVAFLKLIAIYSNIKGQRKTPPFSELKVTL